MPTLVTIDRVDTLSLTEKNGVVTALRRKAIVTGLDAANTDYRVLMEVLAQAGIPAYGSVPPGIGFENLILTERSPEMVDDVGTANVILGYEHLLNNQELKAPAGMDLDGGPTNVLYGRMKCSVQQKHANFYYDPDDLDGFGRPVKKTVVVAFKFPPGDKDFNGQVKTQGGEFTIFQAGKTLYTEGYRNTFNPMRIADRLLCRVNKFAWNGEQPREWLCTEVGYQCVGVATVNNRRTPRYKFTMEIQHNPDSWDVDVVFIDPRTGRPPQGVELYFGPPDGVATVKYLMGIDFNRELQAAFEGDFNMIGN